MTLSNAVRSALGLSDFSQPGSAPNSHSKSTSMPPRCENIPTLHKSSSTQSQTLNNTPTSTQKVSHKTNKKSSPKELKQQREKEKEKLKLEKKEIEKTTRDKKRDGRRRESEVREADELAEARTWMDRFEKREELRVRYNI